MTSQSFGRSERPARAPQRLGAASPSAPSIRANGPQELTPTVFSRRRSMPACAHAASSNATPCSGSAREVPALTVGCVRRTSGACALAMVAAILVPPISSAPIYSGSISAISVRWLMSLVCLVPGNTEACGALDQSNHAIGLREIAPQLTAFGHHIFGQQSKMVTLLKYAFEQFACAVLLSNLRQRENPPKRAYQECRFRKTEIIFLIVAQQEVAAPQMFFYHGDRRYKTRIVGSKKLELGHQQQAGIKVVAA